MRGRVDVRRTTLGLSVAGGALLLGAATYLVSVGFGVVGTTTTSADGTTITSYRRTASVMENSPSVAYGWIAATLALAVVATLLIRYGGVIGAALVIAVMSLSVFAAMLTIGIYLAPGASCFGAAGLLAMTDRLATSR